MSDTDTTETLSTGPLPSVTLGVTREEALGALERRARRGKLAGYAMEDEGFKCDAFGAPFDADLVGRFENGTVVFALRRRLAMPVAAWAIVIFSIQPGAWMADSILGTYFTSYPWFSLSGFWWQVIFMALAATAVPVLLKQQASSKRAQMEHARETIEKISSWIGPGSGTG